MIIECFSISSYFLHSGNFPVGISNKKKNSCDASFSMKFLLTFFRISPCKENDTDFYYQKYIY